MVPALGLFLTFIFISAICNRSRVRRICRVPNSLYFKYKKLKDKSMLNNVTNGNLGADPETSYPYEGNSITKFSLAFKSAKQKTSWIKIICF